MIDLHTHTDESDGTLSPGALLQLAQEIRLEALAVTDHDTFAGYDRAASMMTGLNFELICGIELSTSFRGQSVHLLGYFLNHPPSKEFREWILNLQSTRRARNQELVDKLQSMGFDITLQEVIEKGRNLPGRPHFATLMVEKGYAESIQQAFDQYLDVAGTCYVSRNEPSFTEAVAKIIAGRGLPALPHPGRITRDPSRIEEYLKEMREIGLRAIEVYHSNHSLAESSLYISLAKRLELAITGGSDFHGGTKPNIALGYGVQGNVSISMDVLRSLRALS
jgi:3',5'-nucleoside bisphosphate phosphatase